MTQRPDILRLSITVPAVRDALRGLVVAVAAIGRNGVPSLSEHLRREGVAYGYQPERVAEHILAIYAIADEAQALDGERMAQEAAQRDPMVRDEAGRIIGIRLYDDDGRAFTLADARAANSAEFWQFAAAVGGDEEEE